MSETRRALRQALALGALSVLLGAAFHYPLIKRFARGEFRESFFQAAEYPGVRLITLEEGEDLWRTARAEFFDARQPAVYAEGHVPRSRNLPASASVRPLPADVLKISRSQILVVYCEGGDCQSSLLLAKRLHREGFSDIRVMTGGWAGWLANGWPREKSDGQE